MDTEKMDLTGYGPNELSLHVLNTESLYRGFLRCEDAADLRDLVRPWFHYTEEQFTELLNDLNDERGND